MPAYDHSFSPPAPVADVVVIHPVTGVSSATLLGRNVLNRFIITLDGKNLKFTLRDP